MGFGSWSQQQAQKNVEISRMHNGFQTTNLKTSVVQRENCRIRIIPGGNVTKDNCVLRKYHQSAVTVHSFKQPTETQKQ